MILKDIADLVGDISTISPEAVKLCWNSLWNQTD
jgi:hypothetical protein